MLLFYFPYTDLVVKTGTPHACSCLLQGFPTMVTPVYCSDALQAWINELIVDDCEKLRLWGISTKFLGIANVEVSRYLLCAAA